LLSAPYAQQVRSKIDKDHVPAFLAQETAPLYFPVVRIKITPEKLFVKEKFGVVVVNETQRVLFIHQTGKAAIELMENIEKGEYTFGVDSNNEINILVSNQERSLLKVYKIDPLLVSVQAFDLSREMQFAKKAVFKESKFYIQNKYAAYIYDCIAGIVTDKKGYNELDNIFNEPGLIGMEFQKLIAAGKYPVYNESIFYHIKNIHVNDSGQLIIGKRVLSLQNKIYINLKENYGDKSRNKVAKQATDDLNLLQNKKLKFTAWAWDDGSIAVADPRGFLHLKSSDTSIPEITIVMVLDRVTACWASDQTACGLSFYINEKMVTTETAEEFYDHYIQKFINRLI
jgi:MoxR-vWA-beta-propeller ternary system domain bpX1